MANLLPGRRDAEPFPALDAGDRAAIAARAQPLAGWRFDAMAGSTRLAFEALALDLAVELDEFEATPTPSAGQALLARIDEVRDASLGAPASPDATLRDDREEGRRSARDEARDEKRDEARDAEPAGFWLWYRPGRSLETGEAEIASRGFFDVKDRPPLVLWVDVRARPRARDAEGFDVAVLCWVPRDAAERAEAGCARCSSGALARYADLALGAPPVVPGEGAAGGPADRPKEAF